jgi:hypothetical protein
MAVPAGNLESVLGATDVKMDFYVPKAAERRDLIAYFKR